MGNDAQISLVVRGSRKVVDSSLFRAYSRFNGGDLYI